MGWAWKLPLRPRILRLPGFGLYGASVFALLAILMMMLTAFFQSMPGGLWVHLLKPDAIPTKNDQWNDPLIVRVKDNGSGWDPKLLVKCREIAWSDLDRTLKRELAPRREWVVYVDGDDAVAFQHVATVIDSARSRGAKVVLFHDPQQPDLEGFKN